MHHNGRGIAYVSLEWILVLVQIQVVTLRVYSRTFLTRSVGSDDFFIVIGFVRFIMVTTSSNEHLTSHLGIECRSRGF